MSDVWQPEFCEYGKQDNVAYIRTVRKRREYDKTLLRKGRLRFRFPHGVNSTSASKDLFPRNHQSCWVRRGQQRDKSVFISVPGIRTPFWTASTNGPAKKNARRTSSTDCGVQTDFGGPRLINLEILDSSQQGRTDEMVLKARA